MNSMNINAKNLKGICPAALLGGLLAATACAAAPAPGRVLRVGEGETYAVPSQAAAVAQDGDTVEIDPGTYAGDVAVWRANRLTLRGRGGRPTLDAKGVVIPNQKGLWVIEGNDVDVEDLEFTGASVPDRNGAGIRFEGSGLTVRGCLFHDNEDGVLTNAAPDGDVTITNSEFAHNGQGDGYSHNMYIGHVRRFTLSGCFTHDANVGHDVKSRAAESDILYNRISDDDGSNTSYLLDLPNGGNCRVIGNVFRRGPDAEQPILIAFAEENGPNPEQVLSVVNNTFVNDRQNAVLVHTAGQPTLKIVNTLTLGGGTLVSGAAGDISHNLAAVPGDFRDVARLDLRLRPASKEIGAGTPAGSAGGEDLTPRLEFAPPVGTRPRRARGVLDVGAYAAGRVGHT